MSGVFNLTSNNSVPIKTIVEKIITKTNTKGNFIVPSANGTPNLPANSAPSTFYNGNTSNPVAMDPATISNVGGSQPHENRQPFLVLNFCIALVGVFPSRN